MSFYLGIDLGTSSVKLLLIGADQSVIGSSHAPLDVQRPHPGWSEQEPASWLSANVALDVPRSMLNSIICLPRSQATSCAPRTRSMEDVVVVTPSARKPMMLLRCERIIRAACEGS